MRLFLVASLIALGKAMRQLLIVVVVLSSAGWVTAQGLDIPVYTVTDGVHPPSVVKSVAPTHTPQARTERVQGAVSVDAVVLPDGKVGDVTLKGSRLWRYLGPAARDSGPVTLLSAEEVVKLGLDKQAVAAAKQWTFKPGTKDGKPVAVRISLELTFTLGTARPAR